MERAGLALDRVAAVFYNLTGSHTNPELQAIERTIGPKLSRHGSAIYLNAELWARISAVDADAEGLGDEERRVLSATAPASAARAPTSGRRTRLRIAEIAARMAELGTSSARTCSPTRAASLLPLDAEEDLAGLPDFLRAPRPPTAAEERGGAHGHVITLSRSLIEPFLVFSTRRDLRERAYEAWTRRGEGGGDTDNRGIIARDRRAARRAGAAARLRQLRPLQARRHHGGDARTRRWTCCATVWAPAAPAAARRARPAAGAWSQAEGGNFALASPGLAPLRREAAPGRARPRRERDQAVPAARRR